MNGQSKPIAVLGNRQAVGICSYHRNQIFDGYFAWHHLLIPLPLLLLLQRGEGELDYQRLRQKLRKAKCSNTNYLTAHRGRYILAAELVHQPDELAGDAISSANRN